MGSVVPNMGTARMPVGRKKSARRTSLADALFTKTRQKVLSLLWGDPDRQFFTREVIDRAGSGSGAVQRELLRLTDAGLVTVTITGGRKHYQANRQAPVFEELRGLIVKTVALVDPLREALESIRKGIDLAVVFGSVARGEAHAASDVDLLVVSDALTLEKLFAKLARADRDDSCRPRG